MLSRIRPRPIYARPGLHLFTGAVALILSLGLVAGCGSDEEQLREQALDSLALTAEMTNLEGQMAKLTSDLADDPTEQEREAIERRLARLDERAAELIARAGADSTYEVELEPVNRSGAAGSATLVEADGEVAIEGELEGMRAGSSHSVAIHAHRRGASVCPPRGAGDNGAEKLLAAREAADFYGREAVEFAAVQADVEQVAVTDAQGAGEAPPLTARALIVSGGEGPDGFDPELPVACGTPAAAVAPGEQASLSAVVAGSSEARAAVVDLRLLAAVDPASRRAQAAQERAADRAEAANQRLREALDLILDELEQAGELTDEDRRAIERAIEQAEDSDQNLEEAFEALEEQIEEKLRERRERRAQRRAELEAQRQAELEAQRQAELEAQQPEPAPAPEPAPTPPPNGFGGPAEPEPELSDPDAPWCDHTWEGPVPEGATC